MDIKFLATSKNPSLEISMDKLGYPGIRGEMHVLAQAKDEELSSDGVRLADRSERKFIVSGLLSKQAYGPNINGKIAGDFTKDDGASYLNSSHAALQIQTPASDVSYHQLLVEKNAIGECSMLTLSCMATDISIARNIFFSAAAPFLDHVAYASLTLICELCARLIIASHETILHQVFDPLRQKTMINDAVG